MTPDQRAELRAVAEAATPGVVKVDLTPATITLTSATGNGGDVIRFYAAFDPPVVLALLDYIDRLEAERDRHYRAVIDTATRKVDDGGPGSLA